MGLNKVCPKDPFSCMASNCAQRRLTSSPAIATAGGATASTVVASPSDSRELMSSSTGSLEELVRRGTKPQVYPIWVDLRTCLTKAGRMGK